MDQFNIKKDETNKFLRPINAEDVRYRRIKRMKFEDELKNVLDENCELCFHGTTIWNTEKIISSGNISAEIDRFKEKEDALQTAGKIYVSTMQNLWFTVQHHADLLNFKYPAGCIFVISPTDEEEINSSRKNNLINNVDFIVNPNRLKAIITTPENIEMVKEWMHNSKIECDENIVMDYDAFIVFANTLPAKESKETVFTN
ncbi:MAG: hypothetical protein IJW36_03040 [Clostridia bacterium]|nr:hypothetical protein [Clostridia bacterium]